MKTGFLAGLLASTLVLAGTPALAQECLSFASGEILCDDGTYAYYWSPSVGEWQVLDRAATAAALGLSDPDSYASPGGYGDGDSVTYGSDGALTTTEDGCTMYSAPGYSYGESLSFSSGC
jgi:hypothetical protein